MENFYLIAGLGNPGREYAETRHNLGFMLVERLAKQWRGNWSLESKFQARVAKVEWEGRKILLAQPQTYMNASGESVGAMSRFYQLPPAQTLVVVDDADLAVGQIRLRGEGSSGGHHGLESIEQHLATQAFPRLRLGVGRRSSADREITGHVLGRFSAEERAVVEQVLGRAGEQAKCWLDRGLSEAMNRFNGTVIAPEEET